MNHANTSEDLPRKTTDGSLRSVTIGEREPHNDAIRIVPYDPRWPSRFADLARRVRRALSGKVLLLEHAGSTAVAHDDDRDLYEKAKRELAGRKWRDVDHYASEKSRVVEEILRRTGHEKSARRLAALGGTEKKLRPISRRRPPT